MKHLLIRDFGPIKEALLDLGQVNVITGLQSSGKSCVLKTACYCSWVEKRLQMTQQINGFGKDSAFIDMMVEYYHLDGYVRDTTYIEYETTGVKFWYEHANRKFNMKWNSAHWNFRRPKVSYIPADRNLVAAIPAWSGVSIDRNMLEFMSDWDNARKRIKREENFLNLGLSYEYDKSVGSDSVILQNGKPMDLKARSSVIQSLLPMYVHLDYLSHGQYAENQSSLNFEEKEERSKLRSTIYKKLCQKKQDGELVVFVNIDGYDYGFTEIKHAKRFKKIYEHYTVVDHSEIFLEEPEDNLFPPTQCQLVNWLLENIGHHNDMLFIATHSPYVLSQLVKVGPSDIKVFFTHEIESVEREFTIRCLTSEEISEMYSGGVDLFFNFEMFL